MDALGGSMVNATPRRPRRTSTTPTAWRSCRRCTRCGSPTSAMSATQGLAWGTLQQQFAAGKLGMYIAAPDDIYNVIVPTDKGNVNDIGMGPLPSVTGTPAGSLSGGNDYIFAKQRHPGADRGRHQVHQLRGPDAGHGPVQLRQDQGGRAAGRLPRAGAVRRRGRREDQRAAGQVRDDQHLVLHAVRQRERGRRRRAARRPGGLQDAGPGHAGRADRAERQHPGSC